jgi:radical SAM superfamily enzyme YgiQ (UPF0313 family)
MRVLLVNANTDQVPDPIFPLGASCVAGAAERAGHEVSALDLCFESDPPQALKAAIARHRPQALAFSLRNLDSSSYPICRSFVGDYAQLVQAARQASASPIILGGSAFTVAPKALLERLGADYGVAGEGERAFPLLLQWIESGGPWGGDSHVQLETVGGASLLRVTPGGFPLDSTGPPARHHFDPAKYYRLGGALNIQSKRGCAFECVYCSYPLLEGRAIRRRSPALVVDEWETLVRQTGARHWFVVDSVFNVPLQHAKEICAEIIKRKLRVDWSAYFNPSQFDAELASLLRKSGCRSVEFGVDAGSPAIISTMRKNFSPAQLREASELCHRQGLRICHSLLFGGPGENEATVRETLALMEETRPTAVMAMAGVRLIPGTDLALTAAKEGLIRPDDPLLDAHFYIAPGLGDDLIRLIDTYAAGRPNWIVPGLGIRQNLEVLRDARRRGVKGQLWASVDKEP